METNQAGLRDHMKRAADQFHAQHERLVPLLEGLSAALADQSSRDAQTAAFRLEGAFRAHFLVEEELIFPAIRRLRAQLNAEITALVQDHRELRGGLRALIDQVLRSRLDLAAKSFDAFSLALADHEQREESLVEVLDAAWSLRTL